MAEMLTKPTLGCYADVRAEVAGTISQLAWAMGQRYNVSVCNLCAVLADQLGGGRLVDSDVQALRVAIANLLDKADHNQDSAEAPPCGEVMAIAENYGSYEPPYITGDGGPATD